MNRDTRILPFLALALALAAPAAAAAASGASPAGRWIHLRVDEADDGAQVRINLPLALVARVAEMVPASARHSGRLVVGDEELTAAELRAIWRSLAPGANARRIPVDDPDDTVWAWRHGGELHLRVRHEGWRYGDGPEDVHVRVPAPVVEALLSGDGEGLDIAAAFAALARHGAGELVAASEDGDRVRIWVDHAPEAR
ncbi:MAG TPA: hypothetical protein VF121_14365 [Thermoanaerobaculia bacterium]|nr:hypothetical protein [Thermoanaerobaculia bacterium]